MIMNRVKNRQWLVENEQSIKELFPEEWTHFDNQNPVALGFKLKLMNIDWRTTNDLADIMTFFGDVGMYEIDRESNLIRRNPNLLFSNVMVA